MIDRKAYLIGSSELRWDVWSTGVEVRISTNNL